MTEDADDISSHDLHLSKETEVETCLYSGMDLRNYIWSLLYAALV